MSTPTNEPHNPYSQGGPSYDGGSFNQPPEFHGKTPAANRAAHQQNSAERFDGEKLAQTALVLGILGIVLSPLGWLFGPLAISKANRAEREFRTVASVGKVTGWVATILGLLWILILGFALITRLLL